MNIHPPPPINVLATALITKALCAHVMMLLCLKRLRVLVIFHNYEKSNQELLLVNIQGCGHMLFDPEIASNTLRDEASEILFTAGSLSKVAINNFVASHKCKTFCSLVGLKNLQL